MQRIGSTEGKKYSHGTIQRAVIECLLKEGTNLSNLQGLTVWDSLYEKRKIADYYDSLIDETTLNRCLMDLDTVLSIIP